MTNILLILCDFIKKLKNIVQFVYETFFFLLSLARQKILPAEAHEKIRNRFTQIV